jgi:hypothetical protein
MLSSTLPALFFHVVNPCLYTFLSFFRILMVASLSPFDQSGSQHSKEKDGMIHSFQPIVGTGYRDFVWYLWGNREGEM